jgi:RHS repeat-associated protein
VEKKLGEPNLCEYCYDTLRRHLRRLENLVITYDSNGNTLTKVAGSNTTSYAWDFENRMSSVTLPGSGGTITFKYDPFGRRIYKSSSAGTSIFAYDGDNLVEETNAAGAVVARYSQGANIDEPLAMLRSSATSYYEQDGLGSVTSLSTGAGSLTQTYTFDSFGKQTASSGSLTNPFQYTGRELDSETGLYFNRARYLDPTNGRFLSEDPSQFLGGGNFYRYSFNNPVNFTDPSGLTPSLLDRLLNWLKPTQAPPPPCPPKFNCDADGYRDATPDERARVLAQAAAFNGTPYVWGGKTPDGFDCSGFFCYVVQHSINPNFPSQGTGTMGNSQSGLAPISQGQAGAGDGVLLPGHVGFYNPNPSGQNLLSALGRQGDPNSPGVRTAPIG